MDDKIVSHQYEGCEPDEKKLTSPAKCENNFTQGKKLDLRIVPLKERIDIRFVTETGHKCC